MDSTPFDPPRPRHHQRHVRHRVHNTVDILLGHLLIAPLRHPATARGRSLTTLMQQPCAGVAPGCPLAPPGFPSLGRSDSLSALLRPIRRSTGDHGSAEPSTINRINERVPKIILL